MVRTPRQKFSSDVDGHYAFRNMNLEVFDGESGESVEFIVVRQNSSGTVRIRSGIATTRMERFRRHPEKRITTRLDLSPVDAVEATESFSSVGPYIEVVAHWTDDCFQPTFLESLFCTAWFTMADLDFGALLIPSELLPVSACLSPFPAATTPL